MSEDEDFVLFANDILLKCGFLPTGEKPHERQRCKSGADDAIRHSAESSQVDGQLHVWLPRVLVLSVLC